MNLIDLHKARQWWGFVYRDQLDFMHKYFDSEHIIDCGCNQNDDILYIWKKEGKPIVILQKT